MNIYQKSAVATTGVFLGFLTMEANPVFAAVVTVDFTITDVTQTAAYGGPPLSVEQPLSGFYSFDDSLTPVTVPPESLNLSLFPLVDFNFNFLGREFSLTDISGYGGTATDLFISGSRLEANGVETNFSIFAINRPDFAEPRFNAVAIRSPFVYSINGRPQLQRRTPPVTVPEPATMSSLFVFGLFSILLNKKFALKHK